MGTRFAGSFIVGGCVGLVAQILIVILGKGIADPVLVVLLTMFLLGVIAFILIATNIYSKIAAFGHIAGELTVLGLAYGAAGMTAGIRAEGKGAGPAIVKGFLKVGTLVFIGYIICIIIGVVTYYIG